MPVMKVRCLFYLVLRGEEQHGILMFNYSFGYGEVTEGPKQVNDQNPSTHQI